jgi:hypothetical protein
MFSGRSIPYLEGSRGNHQYGVLVVGVILSLVLRTPSFICTMAVIEKFVDILASKTTDSQTESEALLQLLLCSFPTIIIKA